MYKRIVNNSEKKKKEVNHIISSSMTNVLALDRKSISLLQVFIIFSNEQRHGFLHDDLAYIFSKYDIYLIIITFAIMDMIENVKMKKKRALFIVLMMIKFSLPPASLLSSSLSFSVYCIANVGRTFYAY